MGLGKRESLLQELGPATIDVMRQIKYALDPHWLMNPGKIFEAVSTQVPKDCYEGAKVTASRAQVERH